MLPKYLKCSSKNYHSLLLPPEKVRDVAIKKAIFRTALECLTIFLSVQLLLQQVAFAQGPIDGYMKDKKTLDIALSYSYATSEKYFGAENETFDLEYKAHSAGLFMAYGIIDKIDAVVTLAYVVGQEERNFQDMGLHIKYRPFYKSLREKVKLGVIASTGFFFPVSKYEPDVTGALGQRAKVIPLKAVTQFEVGNGGFINFTGAYHIRLDKVSESTIEQVQMTNPDFQPSRPGNYATLMLKGGMAMRYNYFDLFVEYQKTFRGVNFEEGVVKPSQLYAVDYLKLGAVYFYAMDAHTGFALNVSYIPRGKNIGNIFSISASLIIRIFKKPQAVPSD